MLNPTPLTHLMDAIVTREDDTTRALEKLLARLKFDDVLIWRRYRVEWLHLDNGLKHFALYHDGQCEGIVDVRSDDLLPVIRLRLAALLACVGFEPEQVDIRPFEAIAVPTKKQRLPRLFEVMKDGDDE